MKNILITGASGGIGYAAACGFADSGWHVYALDICEPKKYDNITFIKTDLTNQAQIDSAYNTVSAECTLDAILDLAGIYIMDNFSEAEEETLNKMINVNVLAAWRVNKTFLPILKKHGKIMVVTSEVDGVKPFPFNGIYSLTKSALGAYTDALRTELALLDIRVVKIRPGKFATELIDTSFSSMEKMKQKTKLYGRFTPRFQKIMSVFGGKANNTDILKKKLVKIAQKKHVKACYTVRPGFFIKLYDIIPYSLGTAAIKLLLTFKNK
ncbi:MAG: SDR family NAD(P)-dependent oxidoreductase [Christensenellaceae bacterium]|nr:SDR family NAD(P)-dependent oxidoreductase [Christensenellaceae bacterium]